jgi:hypothetical protein
MMVRYRVVLHATAVWLVSIRASSFPELMLGYDFTGLPATQAPGRYGATPTSKMRGHSCYDGGTLGPVYSLFEKIFRRTGAFLPISNSAYLDWIVLDHWHMILVPDYSPGGKANGSQRWAPILASPVLRSALSLAVTPWTHQIHY